MMWALAGIAAILSVCAIAYMINDTRRARRTRNELRGVHRAVGYR